nr:MAG: rhodanese-like domain-containing protein [Leptolyngbya sp. IPPAS B-1204]
MAKLTHSKLVHSELTIMDLSPTELAQLPNPPLLIDVRSSLEYFTGHAPNARNLSLPRVLMGLSLTQWFLPRWFRELPKEQPIAVICLTAHRSPIAAKKLADAGFTTIYNITGGMMEWRRSGLKTELKTQTN